MDQFLRLLLGLILTVPFCSSIGRRHFVLLDRHFDLTSDWSTSNCTYAEAHSDLNQQKCRLTTVPEGKVIKVIERFPRKRGFWTPCIQDHCEIEYSLKKFKSSLTSFDLRVSLGGFLSGSGKIQVGIAGNDMNGSPKPEMETVLGKLGASDYWSQRSIIIPNVTRESVSDFYAISRCVYLLYLDNARKKLGKALNFLFLVNE